MGGTIHAGQDADIVPRRDLAVWPANALKRVGRIEIYLDSAEIRKTPLPTGLDAILLHA
jgi:hypothetical protein